MNEEHGRPALELVDRIAGLAGSDPKLANYVAALRQELEQEGKDGAVKDQQIEALTEAYEKLTAPANRIGVFLRELDGGQALVVLGDTEYAALIDPNLDVELLKPGVRIKLNEAYAVVGVMESTGSGGLIRVAEVLDDGRMRVGGDAPGAATRLVGRADGLASQAIKSGDEVMLDPTGRLATEHFPKAEAQDYFVEEVPNIPWEKIGGQEEAIRQIRETIEQPMLYPELYKQFDKKPVKGILLFGPPGCGKTMIGKAIAYNLAKDYSAKAGHEVKECFLHISGPKILNMWLGETERMVREIFATAREKAKEGNLVVIFMDEAESVLRTRSAGRQLNISNTVVPQFCAEMDGMVELENVVLILTSNRPDYIDPAVLRPERIDRKIKIRRPDHDASRQILSLYLSSSLPIDPAEEEKFDGHECARKALIESTLAYLWRGSKETEFLKVQFRSSANEVMHWRDLVSGALLKSVVDRAKDTAIRRAIASPDETHGLRESDLHEAISAEFRENEIFPKSDTMEDWLKLIDVEPDMVAAVKPIRPEKGLSYAERSVI
jgi:proteasome-associated ATPase